MLNYKGYNYNPERIDDTDGFSYIWHTVTRPDGTITSFAWSTTQHATQNEFEAWVDAGCPAPRPGWSFSNIEEFAQQI